MSTGLVHMSRDQRWRHRDVKKATGEHMCWCTCNWEFSRVRKRDWLLREFELVLGRGRARTQVPTTRNCTVELLTFGVIAGVSQIWVQWNSLALEEAPSWSGLLPRQVSMPLYPSDHMPTPTPFASIVAPYLPRATQKMTPNRPTRLEIVDTTSRQVTSETKTVINT